MSIINTEYVICPKCGKESRHFVWLSWNSWQNPEMFDPEIRESRTRFECPACHKILSSSSMRYYIPLQYRRWFVVLLRIVLRDKSIGHKLKEETYRKSKTDSAIDLLFKK